MTIIGIDHINIRTSALAETITFYEQVLGLKAAPPPHMDPLRNAWLYDEKGRPLVHINMPAPGEAEPPLEGLSRLNHVAFQCSGFAAMLETLNRADIPHRLSGGDGRMRQIFLHDPNGIRLELNFPE
ncbi:VOC family protein [Sphingosinicella terrae]|uniref:VOC family protein n=1 Tax=Sphingosinicella terrae TaxID=2172047 RepID=UPI000E0D3C79|nr:VOC family protein [Sphingosinicella terrae]